MVERHSYYILKGIVMIPFDDYIKYHEEIDIPLWHIHSMRCENTCMSVVIRPEESDRLKIVKIKFRNKSDESFAKGIIAGIAF